MQVTATSTARLEMLFDDLAVDSAFLNLSRPLSILQITQPHRELDFQSYKSPNPVCEGYGSYSYWKRVLRVKTPFLLQAPRLLASGITPPRRRLRAGLRRVSVGGAGDGDVDRATRNAFRQPVIDTPTPVSHTDTELKLVNGIPVLIESSKCPDYLGPTTMNK